MSVEYLFQAPLSAQRGQNASRRLVELQLSAPSARRASSCRKRQADTPPRFYDGREKHRGNDESAVLRRKGAGRQVDRGHIPRKFFSHESLAYLAKHARIQTVSQRDRGKAVFPQIYPFYAGKRLPSQFYAEKHIRQIQSRPRGVQKPCVYRSVRKNAGGCRVYGGDLLRTGMYAAYALSGVDKKPLEVAPTFYDLRYIVEQPKKIQNIEGNITAKDLPEINLLKWKETERQVLSLINGIEKFPTLYPGKNLPKYKT